MLDFITDKFTEISSKCLDRYAKQEGAAKKDMALIFKLCGCPNNEEVEYMIYKDYKPLKAVSFLEVLGVKLDFKGYSMFVPKFIRGALFRFCDEHKIDKINVRVMLMFNEKNELIMWLYDSSQYIKQITLESLFDATDMVQET